MKNSNVNIPDVRLVQYVRETKGKHRGQLRGVVVAIPDKDVKWLVGWSFCRSSVDSFNKDLGIKIAKARCGIPTAAKMPKDVIPVYGNMVKRAEKYFK